MKKKYYVYKSFKQDIIENILTIRKIEENEKKFIKASIEDLLKTSFFNEEKALNLIIETINKNKKIGIYGDYDADGITGIAVAVSILKKLGANTTYYINDRFEEGFGISIKGINQLKKNNVDLIITVDNGTNSIKELKEAIKSGIKIIVTDHHEINQEKDIIEEILLINPKQKKCDYYNKEITGVGVIFKLLLKVCNYYNKKNLALKQLDLVALGTVADLGKLIGENRVIVKNGLKLFNWEKSRLSFKIFKNLLGLKKEISSDHLSFLFGPILNAESRLFGKPKLAIEIFTDNNFLDLEKKIKKLIEINIKRKQEVEKQIEIVEKNINLNENFIFFYDFKIKEGMTGLIASKLVEKYKKPTIILGKNIYKNIKGSGRSLENFNLKKNLDEIKNLLISYGGHSLACGLTLKKENLLNVKKFLQLKANDLFKSKNSFEIKCFDMEIKIKNINYDFLEKLEKLEPFGKGFEKPIFLIKNIKVVNLKKIQNKHSKFKILNIEFIVFNKLLKENKIYHFSGILEKNIFKEKESIQFIIKNVLEENILIETKNFI